MTDDQTFPLEWTANGPVVLSVFEDSLEHPLDLSAVSSEELDRAGRYRIEEKQRQFLFTRSIGREILAAHFQVSPREIEWGVSGPMDVRIQGESPPACFSCSHSGTFGVLAIGPPGKNVGVDLELSAQRIDVDSLARFCFTDQERVILGRTPVEQQSRLLIQTWVLKESILKAERNNPAFSPLALELGWEQLCSADRGVFFRPGNEITWLNSLRGTRGKTTNWGIGAFEFPAGRNETPVWLAVAVCDREPGEYPAGMSAVREKCLPVRFERWFPGDREFPQNVSLGRNVFLATI